MVKKNSKIIKKNKMIINKIQMIHLVWNFLKLAIGWMNLSKTGSLLTSIVETLMHLKILKNTRMNQKFKIKCISYGMNIWKNKK